MKNSLKTAIHLLWLQIKNTFCRDYYPNDNY